MIDTIISALIRSGKSDDAIVALIEKYEQAESASFVREILSGAKQQLMTADSNDVLDILNKLFYRHDVVFTDDEQYGHEWSYGSEGIQLGMIYEDGSIHIVCDPEHLAEAVLPDAATYEAFIRSVTSVVSHELIHRQQLLSTPFEHQVTKQDLSITSNYDYLSNPKEIDAHAKQAVIDFLEGGYSKNDIKGWLGDRSQLKNHAYESNAFYKYWSYYGEFEDGSAEWRRFLKRMYDFLQQA